MKEERKEKSVYRILILRHKCKMMNKIMYNKFEMFIGS